MSYFHVASFDNKCKPGWAGLNFTSLDAAFTGVTGDWPQETVFYIFESAALRTADGYSTVPGDKFTVSTIAPGAFVLKDGKLEELKPNLK